MLQRRGGSAGQLGGMRSTCPVHAGSPLTAVCQPEKEVSRKGGGEEGREKKGDQEGRMGKEGKQRNEEDTERRQCKKEETQ